MTVMNTYLWNTFLAALLLALSHPLFAQSTSTESAIVAPESDIIASVNGRPIARLSVERIVQQLESSGKPGNAEQVLGELIDLELLTQEAEKIGLEKQPAVASALQLQYTQTMANAYLADLGQGLEFTDEQIRAEYDKQSAQIETDEFHASHILLETEEEAITVITDLANGDDFAELAKSRSTGPSATNGGDLGWFQKANMVAEFSDALIKMEVGSTSAEPVKSQYGWHVIQLIEKRAAAKPDFAALKPGIRNILVRQHLSQQMEALRLAAKIER